MPSNKVVSRTRSPTVTTVTKDKTVVHKASPKKSTPKMTFAPRTLAKTGNAADGKPYFAPRTLKENVKSYKKK